MTAPPPQPGAARLGAVDPPTQVEPAPAVLGRLGPVLRRLAGMQGAWPPVRPRRIVRPEPADGFGDGVAQADALVDAGADLVVAAGSDHDATSALTLLAALLGLEPVAVVGTTGAPGWAARMSAVRDGLRAARPHAGDPRGILTVLPEPAVAGLAGVLAQCAVRRTPVLLSGAPDACAAALAAGRAAPGAAAWMLAGCSPRLEAAKSALSELSLEPLLDLRMERPQGAELALAVLLGAVDLAAGDASGGPGA